MVQAATEFFVIAVDVEYLHGLQQKRRARRSRALAMTYGRTVFGAETLHFGEAKFVLGSVLLVPPEAGLPPTWCMDAYTCARETPWRFSK